MKLYQVYAINPLGEKNVEFATTDANEADDFFAQFEGACGWEFDYGIDEKEIDAKPREWPIVTPWTPATDNGFQAVEDDDLPF